ncbi:hypothetical protein KI387_009396, partial [Taxus chinensis]
IIHQSKERVVNVIDGVFVNEPYAPTDNCRDGSPNLKQRGRVESVVPTCNKILDSDVRTDQGLTNNEESFREHIIQVFLPFLVFPPDYTFWSPAQG